MKDLKKISLIFGILLPAFCWSKPLQCDYTSLYCPVEVVRKFLEKDGACQIAWGYPNNERLYSTFRFRFEQMGLEPRKDVRHDGKDILAGEVWCIQDINIGTGINKKSGCGFSRYNFKDDRYSDLRIKAPMACAEGGIEWLFSKENVKNLKEKSSFYDFVNQKEVPAVFIHSRQKKYTDLVSKELHIKMPN